MMNLIQNQPDPLGATKSGDNVVREEELVYAWVKTNTHNVTQTHTIPDTKYKSHKTYYKLKLHKLHFLATTKSKQT